jgi:peptidyl-prolyl cis-trans isomerase SurA
VKKKSFFLFFGLILFLYGPISFTEAVVDRVVAVVNQEIITFSEVEKMANPLKESVVTKDRFERQQQLQEIYRKTLEKLIEEKLIEQEVKKSGIKVSSKEIEAAIEEVKRRNVATQEDLEKALAGEGLTLEIYKKQIEKGIQWKRLLSWMVRVETKVGEKELRDFYQKNIDRYRVNETYRASHILFIVRKEATPDEIQVIKKKCLKVLEKIKEGEDFGEMALLYSEDTSSRDRGDLGYVKKGELLPTFEKEVLRLKIGEVSGIIRTEFGFHIVKLLDHKGIDPLPFEEVKERVHTDYYDSEMEKALRQFLSTLKEKSIIEIKL